MRHAIENVVTDAIEAAVRDGELALTYVPQATVERPRDPSHGDWACTVALRIAKELGRKPREIAEAIAAHIACGDAGNVTGNDAGDDAGNDTGGLIASVEVAGPGFINLRLSDAALQQVIRDAREQGTRFARPDVGKGRTVNIEFISANPTGPMHVGHGRWAALGNAMCNVCEHAGWKVTREFYINDAGNQMELFGESVLYRYLELCGEPALLPDGGYGGAYVIDIARRIHDEDGRKWCDEASGRDETPGRDGVPERAAYFRERGYTLMLAHMQEICERIGVSFDVWFSERTLYERGGGVNTSSSIESMLATLEEKGYLYEKDGATWFRTTDFSDDKDRVLIKADGTYTYFAPDIAYHLSKFNRGSELLVDIWGADHHGYIPRMKSACEALGHAGKLEVVLGQLVNLFRDGEAVRMSKRTGEMVTFEELIDEVGADATKYLMLSRSTDQPLDFDIEVAKKQDASNPVYYVQYAHARICSLLRRAAAVGQPAVATVGQPSATAVGQPEPANLDPLGSSAANRDPLGLDTADLSLLTDPAELELARVFSRLAEVIEGAARDLAPFRLTRYAEELATGFHSFYTRCQVLGDDEGRARARLYLADATRKVLALVLALLGVTAPEKM
ncbi:MAG: arginine--tRNA ligase [Coriobacteriales bacterium]|jgi:arginyl-tRNA synthetase|nr:arginine--tRNA ligase [Coriobacteriales bacterium]